MTRPRSPFARPTPGLRQKDFVLRLPRPAPEEVAAFPTRALELIDSVTRDQASWIRKRKYNLRWTAGRHFLLAGGTGHGLGGALAVALLNRLSKIGSLTVVARDLKKSVAFEMGKAMQERAEAIGLGRQFHWINDGLAAEGEPFANTLAALREAGAKRLVYINTVAAASSGMLPGYPPVYVKDIDDEGLLEWKLRPLNERAIETTKYVMGTLAVTFPHALEKHGIEVDAITFADWRGSLDGCSRDPANIEYGRQGPYSTSLYLPKRIIQEATSAAWRTRRAVIDCFLPVMNTRALSLIPGGKILHHVFGTLMKMSGIRRRDVPELALAVLDQTGRAVTRCDENPFPRLDMHEAALDLWFFEVLKRLNDDGDSEFYYKRWLLEQ